MPGVRSAWRDLVDRSGDVRKCVGDLGRQLIPHLLITTERIDESAVLRITHGNLTASGHHSIHQSFDEGPIRPFRISRKRHVGAGNHVGEVLQGKGVSKALGRQLHYFATVLASGCNHQVCIDHHRGGKQPRFEPFGISALVQQQVCRLRLHVFTHECSSARTGHTDVELAQLVSQQSFDVRGTTYVPRTHDEYRTCASH